MDFWQKARTFAEEAAKRSQELTIGSSKLSDIVSDTTKRSKELAAQASKRSQEITIGNSKLSDIVSETAKRSKEIVTTGADRIKSEAFKRADQIKSFADGITPSGGTKPVVESPRKSEAKVEELHRYGVTPELREFVQEITLSTFQDFPLQDDSEMSDVPTMSNVRMDLTEWQEKHANLVLSTVKEVSNLRYELCPRVMKERKFWRIYFLLVSNHVAPYEKQYMEEVSQKPAEQAKDDKVEEHPNVITASTQEANKSKQQSKNSTSSSADQDLDIFLLGGDSDEGPDDDNGGSDVDFDKLEDSSDDEKEKL